MEDFLPFEVINAISSHVIGEVSKTKIPYFNNRVLTLVFVILFIIYNNSNEVVGEGH